MIFVHGLGGSPADFTSHANGAEDLIQRIGAIPDTFTDRFSYAPEDLDWVTNPGIGQALANEITCEAAKSKLAGGSGKVIVIAHSMGGLAVREAALVDRSWHRPACICLDRADHHHCHAEHGQSGDDGLFHNVRAGLDGTVPELLAWVVQGVCGGVGFVADRTSRESSAWPLCRGPGFYRTSRFGHGARVVTTLGPAVSTVSCAA